MLTINIRLPLKSPLRLVITKLFGRIPPEVTQPVDPEEVSLTEVVVDACQTWISETAKNYPAKSEKGVMVIDPKRVRYLMYIPYASTKPTPIKAPDKPKAVKPKVYTSFEELPDILPKADALAEATFKPPEVLPTVTSTLDPVIYKVPKPPIVVPSINKCKDIPHLIDTLISSQTCTMEQLAKHLELGVDTLTHTWKSKTVFPFVKQRFQQNFGFPAPPDVPDLPDFQLRKLLQFGTLF